MELSTLIPVLIFTSTIGAILTLQKGRTYTVILGSAAMLLTGAWFGSYSVTDAIAAIDVSTLGLLLAMMLLVGLVGTTGVFQYIGGRAARATRGHPWRLLVAIAAVTALLSMIFDNVTTVVLMVPVTLAVARALKFDPGPILITEAMFANIGGTATLIGHPTNIMIGSAAGLSFNDFLMHALPVMCLIGIVTLILIRFLFRHADYAALRADEADSALVGTLPAITDTKTLRSVLVIISIVIVFFFTEPLHGIPAVAVALVGALCALCVVPAEVRHKRLIEKAELSMLVFFTGLFIM